MENNWFVMNGTDNDIAVSTRIRLARNVAGIPFALRQSKADAEKVVELCSAPLLENPVTKDLFTLTRAGALSDAERISLVERHLISPEFARSKAPRALALSKDEGISVMINEEDHIRLQVIGKGLCIAPCRQCAENLDRLIEEGLTAHDAAYAYTEKYGFLTSCPTNLGTGLRVSVMLHLPALAENGRLQLLIDMANRVGLTVRGYYGEGSEGSGDLFQISNRITMGYSEQELCDNLNGIVLKLIEEERAAREAWRKDNLTALEDRVWRARGILTSVRRIDTEEAMRLLSDYRLGLSMELLPGNVETLNNLLWEIQPASLCLRINDTAAPPERDAARAALLRERLN